MSTEALGAIRAWTRLEAAISAFNRDLGRRHGVTGAQLAILRIIGELGPGLRLSELRRRLVMHPATLGQLLDRLEARGLIELTVDESDRRRRLIEVTEAGSRLIERAPLAGPVRLRHVEVDKARLRRLSAALTDAIVLFGLEEYVS
ncbi:MAG: MarR family transcriptional regulator [Micromonosporaceae bacterium]|nr:MarR family transcriptional regulator [Micromonosporaceae bacterium]